MATVLRAKTAGFCMGVGLALRKLDQALKEHRARSSGRLVMLGPIIHNPQVMNTYMQQGVVLAHSLDAVQPGDRHHPGTRRTARRRSAPARPRGACP